MHNLAVYSVCLTVMYACFWEQPGNQCRWCDLVAALSFCYPLRLSLDGDWYLFSVLKAMSELRLNGLTDGTCV